MRRASDGLTSVLDGALADGIGPGIAVALVSRDGTLALAAAGTADLADGRPMTPDTLSCVGSISKSITAAAILRLRDEGRLDLADPVRRHIPEVAGFRDPFGAAAKATIHDLLRHTAGLPTEAPSPDLRRWDPVAVDVVLRVPASVAWAIPPGTAFKYSNLGYELLGEVIARVSGRPYAAYVTAELLEPMGMADTMPVQGATGAARGHGPRSEDGHRPATGRLPVGVAAGGWWSTARDLARWLRLQLTPERAPPGWVATTIREAQQPAIATGDGQADAYGLGWRLLGRGDHVHLGHGGLTVGFTARIEADLARGIGVAVLLNGIGPDEPATRLVTRLFALAGDDPGRDPGLAPGAVAVAAIADPAGLAGRYHEVGFETVVAVDAVADGWWLSRDGDPGGPLRPTDDRDRFRLDHGRDAGEWLVVLRDPDGRIDGINLAGYPMTRLPD